MDKLFLLSLIGLLVVTAYGAAKKMVYTDLDILEKLVNFDIPEDDAGDDYDSKVFDLPSFSSGKNLVSVDTFGAAGDGVSDDTQVRLRSFCLFHEICQRLWNKTFPLKLMILRTNLLLCNVFLKSGIRERMEQGLWDAKISVACTTRTELFNKCNKVQWSM